MSHYYSKNEIISLFEDHYGKGEGVKKWHAWKIFFLACSEIFRFKKGTEWMVFHYLFKKKSIVDNVA